MTTTRYFLRSGLRGQVGLSAYETALQNGFEGSEAEWLASLNGSDGADGALSPASEAEALAGTDNSKAMTPLRTKTVVDVSVGVEKTAREALTYTAADYYIHSFDSADIDGVTEDAEGRVVSFMMLSTGDRWAWDDLTQSYSPILKEATAVAGVEFVVPHVPEPAQVTEDPEGRIQQASGAFEARMPSFYGNRAVAYQGHGFYDYLVYGGTAQGCISAVRARLRGMTVALVEPRAWLGGHMTSGLNFDDFPENAFNYLVEEFDLTSQFYAYFSRMAVDSEPADGDAVRSQAFTNEMAMSWLVELVTLSGVDVYLEAPIEAGGVIVYGNSIVAVRAGGRLFRATTYGSACQFGDLPRLAGVNYFVGREAASVEEPNAGFQPGRAYPFEVGEGNRVGPQIEPYPTDPATGNPLATGSADSRVQAPNFRIPLTRAADRIAFTAPEGYDADDYAIVYHAVARDSSITSFADDEGNGICTIRSLPNGEFDCNSKRPFSTDVSWVSDGHATATWPVRLATEKAIADYIKGFFYYCANDLPTANPDPVNIEEAGLTARLAAIKADAASLGYVKGKFLDSPHGEGFPYMPYTRETIRIDGQQQLSGRDQTDVVIPGSDPEATYNVKSDVAVQAQYFGQDSHIRQIYADPGNTALLHGEGNQGTDENLSVFDIPYPVMFTRTPDDENLVGASLDNLVVFGTPSVTSLAWSIVRLNYILMKMGERAAEVAYWRSITGKAVQKYEHATVHANALEYLPITGVMTCL